MSNFDRSIVSILEPKIKVDRLVQVDTNSDEAKAAGNNGALVGTYASTENRWGAFIPLIVINTTRLDQDDILSMVLDATVKIPTISVSFRDISQKFSIDTPMDGDVISLYLRPPDEDNQKPIRIDFDIKSISGSPSSNIFGIRGVMKIPGLFAEKCISFPKANSFDHLQDVSEFLKIGFASNESFTDDKMPRLCAFETLETFINRTVDHTYKDDDSFFDWYVDPFYYLCLINVNKQFSLEDKTEDINISYVMPFNGLVQEEKTKSSFKGSLMLTNAHNLNNTNVYITNWAQINNSASVWINNGYRRYSQHFNLNEDGNEYLNHFADPLTTKGSEQDFILQKGRPKDNFYRDQIKFKWMGKQSTGDSGNVHDNYIFANLLNFQNLQEIKKTMLQIELGGLNFYLYRYQRIPVLIYEQITSSIDKVGKLKKRDEDLGENTNWSNLDPNDPLESERIGSNREKPSNEEFGTDSRDQIKNEHLSGYYVIQGIKYTYESPGPVKMSLTLLRREWPIPAKNNNI